MLMPVALLILIMFYSGKYYLHELDDNKAIADVYGYFLTGIVSVWILLGSIMVLICVVTFFKVITQDTLLQKMIRKIFCCCYPKNQYSAVQQETIASRPNRVCVYYSRT
jgi:hypothetical protein